MKTNKSIFSIAIFISFFMFMPFVSGCDRKSSDTGDAEDGKTVHRIAFGSGIFQWNEQPIWKTVVTAKPDLFIFNGDAIYADFDGKKVVPVTKESLVAEWQKMAVLPNYQFLKKNVPIMATWDNHDYGKHDGKADFHLKEFSQKTFLDFFDEPNDSKRYTTPGIYDAKIFGPEGKRVQIILLDNRYFKGPFVLKEYKEGERETLGLSGSMGKYAPNNDPSVTFLGANQWQWLETQLQKPVEIRFIVSGTQIIPDQKGMDEWGNYPLERQKLFDLIKTTGAESVILLTGNVHFSEVSKLETDFYPIFEFTASGLDHVNEKYANAPNKYRVTGPCVMDNFGLVEIDWDTKLTPQVTFKAVGLDGSTVFNHQINLDELHMASEK
jgi:alkaline phosphatase D